MNRGLRSAGCSAATAPVVGAAAGKRSFAGAHECGCSRRGKAGLKKESHSVGA